MMEVRYAGGSFVTSDKIAEALLEYGAALANAERAATVHVPAVGLPENATDIAVLLGPSSQLMAEPVEHQAATPGGADFLSLVDDRMKRLQRTYAFRAHDSSFDWDI